MEEIRIGAETLPEAYHKALVILNEYRKEIPCPDYNTYMKECGMTMIIEKPLMEPRISKLFPGGPRELEQYRQEILYGILDFEIDTGKWDYTYSERTRPYLPWIYEELKRNPFSRRAIISTFKPKDLTSKSPPCLTSMHFFIREGKLDLKVTMRSNDAVKATFMNAFAFICMQEQMANQLGVPVGKYVHTAESFHVYAVDYDTLRSYVQRIERCVAMPISNNPYEDTLVYNYEGDWDQMMEEAQPEIEEMVEEQIRKAKLLAPVGCETCIHCNKDGYLDYFCFNSLCFEQIDYSDYKRRV